MQNITLFEQLYNFTTCFMRQTFCEFMEEEKKKYDEAIGVLLSVPYARKIVFEQRNEHTHHPFRKSFNRGTISKY